MNVVPLPPRGTWLPDARDGRAMRVTWHPEQGVVVLTTWREDVCVASVHLSPQDAAVLVGALSQGLADALADLPLAGLQDVAEQA